MQLVGLLAAATLIARAAHAETVHESTRGVPVLGEFDVVVVGGTTGAVAATAAAAREGAEVFLAAPRPYLGEDMAAHLRLWLEQGQAPETTLARRIYAPEGWAGRQRNPDALDFTITDESDVIDVTSLFVYAKGKYRPGTFDQGKLVDTRERRRVVGDRTVTILDQMRGATYRDTVAQAQTNFDTHGYTVHPFFNLAHPGSGQTFTAYLPYHSMLPQGLRGILVTGIAVSVEHDALPLVRMQPDVQNQGYAAGLAAG